MEKKMNIEIGFLKQKIEKKIRRNLLSPTDFNFLLLAIKESRNEPISISTIKRLWGYVTTRHIPSKTTLSILARFVGYTDWEDFCLSLKKEQEADSSFLSNEQLHINSLHKGDIIELGWEPDRLCSITYLGGEIFRVLSAFNCKLKEGNTFQTTFFCTGHPLYITELYQEDNMPKIYVAGKQHGIKYLKLIRTTAEGANDAFTR